MITQVKKEDIPIIEKFHNDNSKHHLDFDSILYHGVHKKDGKIIGYGAVKSFKEMIISLNKASDREKLEAIDDLLGACIYLAGLEGETNLYCFAENEFADLLIKHFDFQEVNRRILGIRVNGNGRK